MTKEEIIDQVFIQVTGGVLSTDSNVKRFEIENLLPPVLAKMITEHQFRARAEARQEFVVSRTGSYSPPIEFYRKVELTPVKDEDTCEYYAVLPKLLDLPNNWNVAQVRYKKTLSADFIRLRSLGESIGLPETAQGFFFLESENGGHRMWLKGAALPTQNIVVHAVVSPDALEYTDELPVPPSVEADVVSLLVQAYRNQRTMPGDPTLDDTDINDRQ